MSKENNSQNVSGCASSTIDRYLENGDVSADVLGLLIDRENKAREHVFLSQKQDIELESLMTKAEREEAKYKQSLKNIERDEQNNLAYHHAMLNMKKKTKALITRNVQERQVAPHREDGGETEKYLYPSYNEVKQYVNEKGSEFGFSFDVDCVHDPATGLDEVVVTVFHEKGAIRKYSQQIAVKYNSHDPAASTKNRYVSTAAKAMLMNAFGIHFVADKSVSDVPCGDSDVDYTPNVQPPSGKGAAKPDGANPKRELSSAEIKEVTRLVAQSGITVSQAVSQLAMKVGRSIKSIDDVKSSEYDTLTKLLELNGSVKSKHRANG